MRQFKHTGRKHRPLRLYVYGQGAILLGAQFMLATGSMLPLALGVSAGVMLSVPLARQLFAPRAARQPRE